MPVSYTSILISGPLRRQPIKMRPPGSVFLMALVKQIRQDAIEQHWIAHHIGTRCNGSGGRCPL